MKKMALATKIDQASYATKSVQGLLEGGGRPT
jgi:hypothetical protein